MTKEKHNCDNVNCNHNNTKGLCCLFNPDNCKYRQLQKENAELKTEKIPQLERKIASIRGCYRVDLAKLKARTEQVERLKRENVELKNKIRFMGEQIDNLKAIAKYDQLTKAKEPLEKQLRRRTK